MHRNAIRMKSRNPLKTIFRRYSEKDDCWYKVTRVGTEVTKEVCQAPIESQLTQVIRTRANDQSHAKCGICHSTDHLSHNCPEYSKTLNL